MFSAQKIIVSSFYVRAAYQYLQSRYNTTKGKARSAMCLLLFIQVIIITLDITVIVLDLAGYLKLKVFIHSFVYPIKLELEFVVLNQLIEMSRMGVPGISVISHAVAGNQVVRQITAPPKKNTGVIHQQEMLYWSTTRDSAVDLEACQSHASTSSLDFITKPQNLDLARESLGECSTCVL